MAEKQTGRLTQPEDVEVRRPQDSRAARHDWQPDDVEIIEDGKKTGKK